MISLDEARAMLPDSYFVSDAELEETLAFFYFLGEHAYEQVRKETDYEH